MRKRPTSVTVICWILIAMGILGTLGNLRVFIDPEVRHQMSRSRIPIPSPMQYALSFAGLLALVVSGIAMLRRQNWARFLYTICSGVMLVIGLATSPMKLLQIPSILVYLTFVLFLFRPNANQFFKRSKVSDAAESH
jgi:hypothetical protein